MLSEATVGQRVLQDGNETELRLTRYGGLAVNHANVRFYDCVSRGNCFVVSQQAAAALGTALTATAVTLTLYNPTASGRNLVLIESTLVVPVATSAGQVVYAVNDTAGQAAPATTTAATIRNCLLGAGSASQARAFTAATLPSVPVAVRNLAGIISATPGGVHTIVDNVDGKLIITPGTMVTIQGITTNATGVISLLWEEVVP
jgi:hypothetical protein